MQRSLRLSASTERPSCSGACSSPVVLQPWRPVPCLRRRAKQDCAHSGRSQRPCSFVQPLPDAQRCTCTTRALGRPQGSPVSGQEGGECVSVERSALVNEETVYFIFQLDLDTQLQRALNQEAYEQAQAIRSKRQRVDEAFESMKERKSVNAGVQDSGASVSVADVAAEGLRLRTAMTRAIEREDYKEAAALRDQLAALDAQAKRSQELADQTSGGAGFAPKLRLGQRIVHKVHGYRGVVVGWDARCCESEEWLLTAGPGASDRVTQPHYHVLVDQRDWAYDALQPPVAYIAEELCWVPEQGGAPPPGPAAALAPSGTVFPVGTSWVEAFAPKPAAQDEQGAATAAKQPPAQAEPLAHPYTFALFLGVDARGDYIPCRQLRSKYNVARRDVYRPGEGPAGSLN